MADYCVAVEALRLHSVLAVEHYGVRAGEHYGEGDGGGWSAAATHSLMPRYHTS